MRTHTLIAVCSSVFLASSAPAQIAQNLGTLSGRPSYATGLSGDGAVVVGYDNPWGQSHAAFRWTAATGMQDIGNLGGPSARAWGVSSDGDTIVGDSTVPSGDTHAFRWVRGVGMQDLGTLGGTTSSARDVSADGQVVVGFATRASSPEDRAFRWTEATGMVDLGTLGGLATEHARANGVSGDGAVVVGLSHRLGSQGPFRWTAAGGMIDLGTPPGADQAIANAANFDGSVIVGGQLAMEGRALGVGALRVAYSGSTTSVGSLPERRTSTLRGSSSSAGPIRLHRELPTVRSAGPLRRAPSSCGAFRRQVSRRAA